MTRQNIMEQDQVYSIFKDTGALLEGHFELRSGLHSDRFFQCANVLRYPRVAEQLCADLAARIVETAGTAEVDAVIAPAMGGIVVGHEIARAMAVKSIFAEKQEGKLVLRRFTIDVGETFIVAEDVVTRGGRVQETVDIVEANGGRIAAIALLVDRSGGSARFNYPTVSLMKMEPVTYEPAECPLCARGIPLEHPGS